MQRALLARAAIEWLEHLRDRRGLARTSIAKYESSIAQLIRHLPDQYDHDDLRHALDQRIGERATTHVRRSSFITLRLFFEYWEGHGGPLNPLREMDPPPVPDDQRPPFNADEVKILDFRLKSADIKHRCMVLLMVHQGFREGSVANLKVSDVDLHQGRIRATGKAKMDRWMPMGPTVADALAGYLSYTGITEGHVFTGPHGRMSERSIRNAWRKVAGPQLAHLKAHQLRHTFANALLRGTGADIHSVMRLMGHKSLKSTQRYLWDDLDAQRAAIIALPGALGMSQ